MTSSDDVKTCPRCSKATVSDGVHRKGSLVIKHYRHCPHCSWRGVVIVKLVVDRIYHQPPGDIRGR